MPYLSASAVVIHYEEALYQVYAPFTFYLYTNAEASLQILAHCVTPVEQMVVYLVW